MVSIMKMYACSTTIRMWKMAQPSPRMTDATIRLRNALETVRCPQPHQ